MFFWRYDCTIFRKEKEDLYTFFNGNFSNVLFVNEEFKEFIVRLKTLGEFKVDDLISKSGELSTKLENMFKVLIEKKYLI